MPFDGGNGAGLSPIADRMREIFAAGGWCKRARVDGGRHCLLGAYQRALGRSPRVSEIRRLARAALDVLENGSAALDVFGNCSLASWDGGHTIARLNDRASTRYEDICRIVDRFGELEVRDAV